MLLCVIERCDRATLQPWLHDHYCDMNMAEHEDEGIQPDPLQVEDEDETLSILTALKRRAQTEKARCMKLLMLMCKNTGAGSQQTQASSSEQNSFVFGLKTGNPSHSTDISRDFSSHNSRDNRRSIYAYLISFMVQITRIFKQAPIQHVVVSSVVDDFSIRLAQKGKGVQSSAVACASMNNVQHVFARRQDGSCFLFRLFQPMLILADASAKQMYRAFTSWLFITPESTGCRLVQWGLPPSIVDEVPLKALLLVTDALTANKTMFNEFCRNAQNIASIEKKTPTLSLHFFCGIHQICLVRRPVVLALPGYWSSLVRLGHLVRLQSFRTRFQKCLTHVIISSFIDMSVKELPEQSSHWRNRSAEIFNSLNFADNKEHMLAAATLLRIDNSDPCSLKIIHYCKGSSCHASSKAALREYLDACLCLVTSFFKVIPPAFFVCVCVEFYYTHELLM